MRWISVLLAASLLIVLAAVPADAQSTCVHKSRLTACYDGDACTPGEIENVAAWQSSPACHIAGTQSANCTPTGSVRVCIYGDCIVGYYQGEEFLWSEGCFS